MSEQQENYLCSLSAQDLRIGNWVYDGERTQFPMQVVVIGTDWVLGNEGGAWESDIKDLRPIPITKEILKKAGFNESYCYDCKRLDDARIMDYYKHESRLRVWYKTEDVIFECHGVHHLHQLQNAYRMATGEELKVQP